MKLIQLKNELEQLDDKLHIEIFKILKDNNIDYSENKNGIFVNLSCIDHTILEQLVQYLSMKKEQNYYLEQVEHQKEEYKSLFFKDEQQPKDNETSLSTNNTQEQKSLKITKNRRGRRKKKN